jgi:hypothetical protein
MTLFELFVSVPAFLFCCVAMVHFQQEILNSAGTGMARARRISLDSQDDATAESNSDTLRSGSPAQGEVYQLESAYLGPIFVVRAGNGRGWELTNACDEHHRMASVTRG